MPVSGAEGWERRHERVAVEVMSPRRFYPGASDGPARSAPARGRGRSVPAHAAAPAAGPNSEPESRRSDRRGVSKRRPRLASRTPTSSTFQSRSTTAGVRARASRGPRRRGCPDARRCPRAGEGDGGGTATRADGGEAHAFYAGTLARGQGRWSDPWWPTLSCARLAKVANEIAYWRRTRRRLLTCEAPPARPRAGQSWRRPPGVFDGGRMSRAHTTRPTPAKMVRAPGPVPASSPELSSTSASSGTGRRSLVWNVGTATSVRSRRCRGGARGCAQSESNTSGVEREVPTLRGDGPTAARGPTSAPSMALALESATEAGAVRGLRR